MEADPEPAETVTVEAEPEARPKTVTVDAEPETDGPLSAQMSR